MADIGEFGYADDVSFVRHLVKDPGVAAVPGSSFYSDSNAGVALIRFCFCKKYETLEKAGDRLRRISSYPVGTPAR